MNYPSRKAAWIAVLTLFFSLAACGGDDATEPDSDSDSGPDEVGTLECGAGTVLADGECVVSDFDCDEGQVPLPSGVCRTREEYCGSGSSFDAQAEKCVSDAEVSCGEGTVAVEGRCVVEGAMSCGEGTVLADGVCRISEEVCGSGTALDEIQCVVAEDACDAHAQFDVIAGECVDLIVISCGENTTEINNRCVSTGSFADELAQEADLDYSDAERRLSPGSDPGDRIVFTGTMDGSGDLVHIYPFDGVEGQWLSITIYPRGIPSVGFRLQQVVGSWQRQVSADLASVPSRTVVPPSSGDYDLVIETSVTGAGGSFGSDDWRYVGVVEVIEAPQAQPWDLFEETTGGSLKSTAANWLEIELQQDEQAILRVEDLGVDIVGATLKVWTSPQDYSQRFALEAGSSFLVETTGAQTNLYLHFDAEEFRGPRTNFNVSAVQTITLLAGETSQELISAEAGEVIMLSHRSSDAETLTGRVFLGDQQLYLKEEILADNRNSYDGYQTRREFFYVQESGDYTVEFENTSGGSIDGFISTTTTTEYLVFEPDGEQDSSFETTLPAQELERGDWRFIVIDAPGPVRITGSAEVESGDPEVTIYDNTGADFLARFNSVGTVEDIDFILEQEDIYIMAVHPFSTLDGGITVELESTPTVTLAPGETQFVEFDANIFDIFTAEISFVDGSAPDVRLFNPDGAMVFEYLTIDKELDLLELIPGTGEFTLEVTNSGEENTLGLTTDFDVVAPVDVLSPQGATSANYFRESTLAEGEREFFLLRTQEEFAFLTEALFDDEEEASLRLLDMNSKTTVASASDAGSTNILRSMLPEGVYLVEVEALTELAEGYEFDIYLAELLTYETSGSIPEVAEDSLNFLPLTVPGACNAVMAIEIYILTEQGFYRDDTTIDLIAPNGDEYRIFSPPFFVNSSTIDTVFPTETNTVESLAPLIGESGAGEWNVRLLYEWGNEPTLHQWSLTVVCI